MRVSPIGVPADELPLDSRAPRSIETATFALGCFWQPEAMYGVLPGVVKTRVGYARGDDPDPRYRAIGDHSEVIQVDYDPNRITYEELLDVFWNSHDPRTQSRSRRYENAVLFHDEDQRSRAERKRERVPPGPGNVATRIEPLDGFTLAEHIHQKNRLRRIPILVSNLASVYSDQALVNSTVAARVNGYVAGHGTLGQLRDEIDDFGLSAAAREGLIAIVE